MDLNITQHLPENFSSSSRVWVYQASRMFFISEALEIEEMFNEFTAGWNSHGTPVKGAAHLFFGRFIVLMADETATGVSGCSTDSSVRLIKSIEQKFNNNLFDRQLLAFIVKDKIEVLPLAHLKHAIDNDFVTPETLYFNNTVLTKEQLEKEWIIPAGESWLKNKFKANSL
ncbi:MAG: hypothetical protein QM687_10625 [Ferruginibacter sp.]